MSFVIKPAASLPDTPALAPDWSRDDEEDRIAERVAEGIAQLRAAAEAEGRIQGAAEARAAVEPILAQQRRDAAAALSALRQASDQLTAPLAGLETALGSVVADLAVSLARHILTVDVTLRTDGIEALVRQLLAEALAERQSGQTVMLHLHPKDLDSLAPRMATADIRLVADDTLSRGGAVIALQAEGGDPFDAIEWDARLETRIAAIWAAMTPAEPTR